MTNWKLLIIEGSSYLVNLESEILDIPNFGRFASKSISKQEEYVDFEFMGKKCTLVGHSLEDIHSNLKRGPQIISPKDIAWLIYKSGISTGDTVIEVGSGSAALTVSLAQAIAPNGKVITFEANSRHYNIAKNNICMSPWQSLIDLRSSKLTPDNQVIKSSAVFLDIPNPHELVSWAKQSLTCGSFFISYLPTVNQVEVLVSALKGWKEIEITEIIQRKWQSKMSALRPESTMIGHTGFIVSARRND